MSRVYITKTSHFLPNEPVTNERMETYLGKINECGSRAKAVVLRNNKIKTRYYAIDEEGNNTHSNAEMAAEAIKQLFDSEFPLSKLELLASGTSSPDAIMPSHALQVHHQLSETKSIPVYSSAGVCCSGMHAFEIAYMSILHGKANNAVSSGSELASRMFYADKFELELKKLKELNEHAILAFEEDFLRFMLSDGAGAFLLQNEMTPGLNYEIEWIESISYANKQPVCMYQGWGKNEAGELISWKNVHPSKWAEQGVFAVHQDTRILEDIIPLGVQFTTEALKKHNIDGHQLDYFLPHISSMYFYNKLIEEFKKNEFDLPEDIYYTCLSEIGNIGSASIYAHLDKLDKERELKEGQRVLLVVPESAQFQYSVASLIVRMK